MKSTSTSYGRHCTTRSLPNARGPSEGHALRLRQSTRLERLEVLYFGVHVFNFIFCLVEAVFCKLSLREAIHKSLNLRRTKKPISMKSSALDSVLVKVTSPRLYVRCCADTSIFTVYVDVCIRIQNYNTALVFQFLLNFGISLSKNQLDLRRTVSYLVETSEPVSTRFWLQRRRN